MAGRPQPAMVVTIEVYPDGAWSALAVPDPEHTAIHVDVQHPIHQIATHTISTGFTLYHSDRQTERPAAAAIAVAVAALQHSEGQAGR